MHSHRDYFLKHLGIGEIWQLRQRDFSAVLVPDPSPDKGVLASQLELSGERDDIAGLVNDVAQCAACSLCASYGKHEDYSVRSQCDLVLLVDWSDQENLSPELALQFERLAKNIASAAINLGLHVQLLPLLQSAIPTESIRIPLAESLVTCGSFLQRFLHLQRPKYVMSFGAHCASTTGVVEFANGTMGRLDWNDTSIFSFPSLYEVLRQGSLKRVVWQQLCHLASR